MLNKGIKSIKTIVLFSVIQSFWAHAGDIDLSDEPKQPSLVAQMRAKFEQMSLENSKTASQNFKPQKDSIARSSIEPPQASRIWQRRTSAAPHDFINRDRLVKDAVLTFHPEKEENKSEDAFSPRAKAILELEKKQNLKIYAEYLRNYQRDYHKFISSRQIPEELHDPRSSARIRHTLSKAVRDLCSRSAKTASHTIVDHNTIAQISKTEALNNLKKLLDHLASFLNDNAPMSLTSVAETEIRRLLRASSKALITCKDIPVDFDLTVDSRLPDSLVSPRLTVAKSVMRQAPELKPDVARASDNSVNEVYQVSYAKKPVAFKKPCLDNAKYAEKENRRFGGINDLALAVFSSLHKHEVNFHVPVASIDDSEQILWSTQEGFASLAKVKNNQDIIGDITLESVQKYFILALLFNFSDSHLDNIRVGKDIFGRYFLISIDHAESLQAFYEVPGTATLRLGQYLSLFRRDSQTPMLSHLRNFLISMDPAREQAILEQHLQPHVSKLVERENNPDLNLLFARKLDHFRLNMEVLRQVALNGGTFDDAFELKRSQFRENINRNATPVMKKMIMALRSFFVKDSLVISALKGIKMGDNAKTKAKLAGDSSAALWMDRTSPINEFDPAIPHDELVGNPNFKKHGSLFRFEDGFRLDEADFAQIRSVVIDQMTSLLNNPSRYHRMTETEITAYSSIGF